MICRRKEKHEAVSPPSILHEMTFHSREFKSIDCVDGVLRSDPLVELEIDDAEWTGDTAPLTLPLDLCNQMPHAPVRPTRHTNQKPL